MSVLSSTGLLRLSESAMSEVNFGKIGSNFGNGKMGFVAPKGIASLTKIASE